MLFTSHLNDVLVNRDSPPLPPIGISADEVSRRVLSAARLPCVYHSRCTLAVLALVMLLPPACRRSVVGPCASVEP